MAENRQVRLGSWEEKGAAEHGDTRIGNEGKYMLGFKSSRCREAKRRDLFPVLPDVNWE